MNNAPSASLEEKLQKIDAFWNNPENIASVKDNQAFSNKVSAHIRQGQEALAVEFNKGLYL